MYLRVDKTKRTKMKWDISLLLLLTTLTGVVVADGCGNRCTSTQLCGRNGICIERSNVTICEPSKFIIPSWLQDSYYCLETEECCSDGCMPEGSDCCGINSRYCESGLICCQVVGCCPPGSSCSGSRCVPDEHVNKKMLKSWYYGITVISGIFVLSVVVAAALFILRRRKKNSNGGIVYHVPNPINGQEEKSNLTSSGVPWQTDNQNVTA